MSTIIINDMEIINTKNLKKEYAKETVLDIPLLTVCEGEILGVIGNNGAGKTTLMRLILDLIKASSGNVYSKGTDVSKDDKWKCYTSAYLDANFLIDFLLPEEYFGFIADCYKQDAVGWRNKAIDFKPFFNDEILNKKKYIRQFSQGNKQKIGVFGSVFPEPEVLLLDEPFNFLDPTAHFFLLDYLKKLNKEKRTTMIISSHNLDSIYDIATKIIVLEKGRIVKCFDSIDAQMKEELSVFFRLV